MQANSRPATGDATTGRRPSTEGGGRGKKRDGRRVSQSALSPRVQLRVIEPELREELASLSKRNQVMLMTPLPLRNCSRPSLTAGLSHPLPLVHYRRPHSQCLPPSQFLPLTHSQVAELIERLREWLNDGGEQSAFDLFSSWDGNGSMQVLIAI